MFGLNKILNKKTKKNGGNKTKRRGLRRRNKRGGSVWECNCTKKGDSTAKVDRTFGNVPLSKQEATKAAEAAAAKEGPKTPEAAPPKETPKILPTPKKSNDFSNAERQLPFYFQKLTTLHAKELFSIFQILY